MGKCRWKEREAERKKKQVAKNTYKERIRTWLRHEWIETVTNSFLRTLYPQKPSFWKITRYFTTPKQTIPPLLRNGTQIFRSSEKADELARQFERSHNLTLHMSTPHNSQVITPSVNRTFRLPTPSTPSVQPTNPSEVRRHILSLKPRTAPGNDGISTVMLRHLSKHAIQHFTLLFNFILQLGYFPTIWKAAKVIPIHKLNKPPQTLIPTVPSASLAQSVNFLNASSPQELLHSLIRTTWFQTPNSVFAKTILRYLN